MVMYQPCGGQAGVGTGLPLMLLLRHAHHMPCPPYYWSPPASRLCLACSSPVFWPVALTSGLYLLSSANGAGKALFVPAFLVGEIRLSYSAPHSYNRAAKVGDNIN